MIPVEFKGQICKISFKALINTLGSGIKITFIHVLPLLKGMSNISALVKKKKYFKAKLKLEKII